MKFSFSFNPHEDPNDWKAMLRKGCLIQGIALVMLFVSCIIFMTRTENKIVCNKEEGICFRIETNLFTSKSTLLEKVRLSDINRAEMISYEKTISSSGKKETYQMYRLSLKMKNAPDYLFGNATSNREEIESHMSQLNYFIYSETLQLILPEGQIRRGGWRTLVASEQKLVLMEGGNLPPFFPLLFAGPALLFSGVAIFMIKKALAIKKQSLPYKSG